MIKIHAQLPHGRWQPTVVAMQSEQTSILIDDMKKATRQKDQDRDQSTDFGVFSQGPYPPDNKGSQGREANYFQTNAPRKEYLHHA